MQWKGGLQISLVIAGAMLVACGDDGVVADAGAARDSGRSDAGIGHDTGMALSNCPPSAPLPDDQMGPCCARASNAERLDAPEFRVAGLDITQPNSLDQPFIKSILQGALNDETFNWLIRVSWAGTDGVVDVTTGFGRRQSDGTFSFEAEGAFVPATTTATLTGSRLTAEAVAATLVLPVVDGETGEPTMTLPLREFTLAMATWGPDRTCIGHVSVDGQSFLTTQASLSAYVTVEDANNADVAALEDTLCNLLRGMNADGTAARGDCTTQDQAGWGNKPDARCDDAGCNEDCDADTTCNAWTLAGGFAAQGVVIE